MALTLTERLIRDRVNLTHENFEDIKSLSLPGTFHEKIVSIGTSLRKFSRLKSLDFSRNALESLQGLDHLQLLERLNLYYNNVGSLEELARLRHNPNLKDLDLRLNPVTRNEPDYRLYLIHMLPNLQKLDDRGVRDRERQAALTHFSSSQAAEMTPQSPKNNAPAPAPLPRTDLVTKLMRGPSVLVDDDVTVIDTMNRNHGDFGIARPLTGSTAKESKAEEYSLENLKDLDQPRPAKHQAACGKAFVMTIKDVSPEIGIQESKLREYKERYPNILSAPLDCIHKIGEGHHMNANLQFLDEVDANSKYRGQGYFTPNPEVATDSPGLDGEVYQANNTDQTPQTRHHRPDTTDQTLKLQTGILCHCQWSNSTSGIQDPSHLDFPPVPSYQTSQDKEKVLVSTLLNLVDRYWNGSKSLHKHQKFIEQALRCLNDYNTSHNRSNESENLNCHLTRLEKENTALKRLRASEKLQHENAALSETELKQALKNARKDVERLHEELRQYVNENVSLQRRLDQCNSDSMSIKQHSAASESSLTSPGQLDDLHKQNAMLSQELDQMRSKAKQYTQLQELASMLQESHKSLVETNELLLHEMKEAKHKHQHEIEQMHWSFQKLKSSMLYNTKDAAGRQGGDYKVRNESRYTDSLDLDDGPSVTLWIP